jgi:hypothetical protein
MYDNTATTKLLGFLEGGIPPVFEEYGAEALDTGTAQRAGGASRCASYEGVFDLSTPQGRAAWKANAPAGVSRIALEDGDAWLQRLLDTVQEGVSMWMEGEGIEL